MRMDDKRLSLFLDLTSLLVGSKDETDRKCQCNLKQVDALRPVGTHVTSNPFPPSSVVVSSLDTVASLCYFHRLTVLLV
jgi:hypothetical protein